MLPNDETAAKKGLMKNAELVACALCFCSVALLAASRFLPFLHLRGNHLLLLIIGISAAAFLVPSVTFGILSRKNTAYNFSRPKKGTLKLVFSGGALLVCTVLLSKSIVCFVSESPAAPAGSLITSVNYFGALFCYTLLPAVLEELLFRGIAFSMFEKKFGGLCAIVFTSLFFGMVHLSGSDFVTYFLSGAILGVIVYITRSVFVTMILHLFNNTLSFYLENSLFRISTESKSGLVAIFLLTGLVLLCLFWFLTDVETVCRKRYLSAKRTSGDETEKICPRLFPVETSVKDAFLRILISPFLSGAVIIFILYITLL